MTSFWKSVKDAAVRNHRAMPVLGCLERLPICWNTGRPSGASVTLTECPFPKRIWQRLDVLENRRIGGPFSKKSWRPRGPGTALACLVYSDTHVAVAADPRLR